MYLFSFFVLCVCVCVFVCVCQDFDSAFFKDSNDYDAYI